MRRDPGMPSARNVEERALDRRPFANGTEGYGWMEAWCATCVRDSFPDMDGELQCPLLDVAMFAHKTPAEWLPQADENGRYSIADQYHCVFYRSEDEGGPPEPQPIPDPPGQLTLAPRGDFEGTRMLKPTAGRERVHA